MGQNMRPFLPSQGPAVSVLMSCYNAERWLRESVDSVLSQTFRNLELILVDDGSTDDTRAIIQSYCERDSRIVPLFKSNSGLADSLNAGIAIARGAWIARLDADDLCEPERLYAQVNFIQKNGDVVLLGTGYVEVDEFGRKLLDHRFPSSHRILVRHLERMQCFFPHSSALIRVDTLRAVGGYSTLMRKAQDWHLWLKLSRSGRVSCLPVSLVKFRKHAQQVSKENSGRSQLCYGLAATVCHFLAMRGVTDPSISSVGLSWHEFFSWVEQRMLDDGLHGRLKSWVDARAESLLAEQKLLGALRFGVRILRARDARLLVWEKVFGTSLPKRLARQWIRRSFAAGPEKHLYPGCQERAQE